MAREFSREVRGGVKKGNKVAIRPIRSADLEQLHVLLGDVEAKGAFLPTVMHSSRTYRQSSSRPGSSSNPQRGT